METESLPANPLPDAGRGRILCVDDEPHVLDGLSAILRPHFKVTTDQGGVAGIATLKAQGPFSIVVSDLKMPLVNGAAFLRLVREASPDTVRVLLTGDSDMDGAAQAVNEGQVYRFLIKPCPSDLLIATLKAAEEHYRLVTAERILKEQTLRGSINLLMEILALSNPERYGQAIRVRKRITELASRLELPDQWQLEVAALLSQIGHVTLPGRTINKLHLGLILNEEEQRMVDRLPSVTDQLLANIPRMEPIREIIRHRERRFDGHDRGASGPKGEELPLGSRLLKLVLDFDTLEDQGMSIKKAITTMQSRVGWYDPALLSTLIGMFVKPQKKGPSFLEVRLSELKLGMVFAEDVKSRSGALLIARGHEVTASLLERIQNGSSDLGIQEPLLVMGPS